MSSVASVGDGEEAEGPLPTIKRKMSALGQAVQDFTKQLTERNDK